MFDGLQSAIAEAFGDTIRETFPARLGYLDSDGNTNLRVPDSIADKPESFYFHAQVGNQPMVGIAANTGLSPLEEKYIIYGMPIRIRRIGKNEYQIAGLDGVFAAEYVADVPLTSPNPPVTYSNIIIGLLDETSPDASMRMRVHGGWYDTTYIATQTTADFSASPLDVDSGSITIPSGASARYVMVQIDPETGTLGYKAGDTFSQPLSHYQAWQLDQNDSGSTIFHTPQPGNNLVGYAKLQSGQAALYRVKDIWPAQQLLSAASVDDSGSIPAAHASTHISDGSDVIDGDKIEVTFVPSNYTRSTTPSEVDAVDQLTAHLSGIDTALGSGGGGGTATLTAGENLSAGDVCHRLTSDGEFYKVDIDTASLNNYDLEIVIAAEGITADATGTFALPGNVVTGLSGLTTGAGYWVGDTAGQLASSIPSLSVDGSQKALLHVGYALSTTSLWFNPQRVDVAKVVSFETDDTATVTHYDTDKTARRTYFGEISIPATDTVEDSFITTADDYERLKGPSGAGGTTDINASGTTGTIGNFSGTTFRWAQSFQVAAGEFSGLKITFGANSNSPTGGVTIELQNDSGGDPDGTAFWSTTHNPTASSENTITVSDMPFLAGSTTYWLVVYATTPGSFGSNDAYTWQRSSTSTYANGVAKSSTDGGSTWGAANGDNECEITTSAITQNDALAQSWTATAGDRNAIGLYISKVGSPTDGTIRIETDSTGDPSGTLVDANATATLDISAISTTAGWVKFALADTVTLSATTYHIVLDPGVSGWDADNYVRLHGVAAGGAGGSLQWERSSVWSAADMLDANYRIYAPGFALTKIAGIDQDLDIEAELGDGAGADTDIKSTFTYNAAASRDCTVGVGIELS